MKKWSQKQPHILKKCVYNLAGLDSCAVPTNQGHRKELSGTLYEVLSRLDALLEINISTATDPVGGPREIRQPDYPHVALQQFARNAVMHRTYDTNTIWLAEKANLRKISYQ